MDTLVEGVEQGILAVDHHSQLVMEVALLADPKEEEVEVQNSLVVVVEALVAAAHNRFQALLMVLQEPLVLQVGRAGMGAVELLVVRCVLWLVLPACALPHLHGAHPCRPSCMHIGPRFLCLIDIDHACLRSPSLMLRSH